MEIYAIIITVITILCVVGIGVLLIMFLKAKNSVEQVAADNLKRGKEEAADFVRLTIDKVQEDKNKLNEMSDRDLMIETMLALAGQSRRLDRIEEKIQGVYNYKAYTEGLAEQITKISGMATTLTEDISGATTTVAGFKQLVEATRIDVDKLNTSISDVENIKERLASLINNINNSVGELKTLNDKLTLIESKIQGIYEYKTYLDEIVVQVNKVKGLSDALSSSITYNDNKVNDFNQTIEKAHSGVDKLNNSLTDVDRLKDRISVVVEDMNKSVYEITYMNGKITELVTMTNEVLQTYGDAPMVKLTNIEMDIGKIKEVSQNTVNIMDSIVANIQETIEESISDIEADVKTVRTVVDKALADEYDYDSIYSKIRDIADDVSSLEDNISNIQNDTSEVKTVIDKALADEYDYDSVYSKISDVLSNINSIESKVEDVKSTINSVESDVRDVKYTVDNMGNGY